MTHEQKRVKVDIKWDEGIKSFHAYKKGTNEKLNNYFDLEYSQTDNAKMINVYCEKCKENHDRFIDSKDDSNESIKTFKDKTLSKGKMKDSSPDKNIKLSGYVTINIDHENPKGL